jgi:hypothetical protein
MAKGNGNGNGKNGNGKNGNGKNGNGKMGWLEALKKWNKDKGGKYEIPKKGSKEYKEVEALMK